MSEMIERVAKALFEFVEYDGSMGNFNPQYFETIPESHRDFWLRKAKIAIWAMREPTEAMVRSVESHILSACSPEAIWRAMVDEALK
jgi:hypothetical protein